MVGSVTKSGVPTNKTNIAMWVSQVVLCLTLLSGTFIKLFTPRDQLTQMMPWTADNRPLLYLTAFVDFLGGVGILLPALLNIKPQLTVYAALGTVLLMIAAAVFHIMRDEAHLIGVNIIFGIMALFVAIQRNEK